MRRLLIVAAALIPLAAAGAVHAAPPPNDSRAAAQALTQLPAALDGTTADATAEAGDPACGAAFAGTVWYSLDRSDGLAVVVRFAAHGELDAVVAAFQVVKTGLKTLRCDVSDEKGKAGFSFEGQKGASYLIMVGQRAASEPGTFHIEVSAPPRPQNDDRVAARVLQKLPAKVTDTTLGASVDPNDPRCGSLAADVWYRIDRRVAGPVVLTLQASGDLDATLGVYRRVRSQLREVMCTETDDHGRVAASFNGEKGAQYLIAVGQIAASLPGDFTLSAVAPESPSVGPGARLPARGAASTVDPLRDRDDAYAYAMQRGVTYRVNLLSRSPDRCIGVWVFRPGTKKFGDAEPVGGSSCGGYLLFTPGPDGGGVYSLLVVADPDVRGQQGYRLLAAPAGPDDVGPGVPLTSGKTSRGSLSGGGIDIVDLYRFEVPHESDVDLTATTSRKAEFRLGLRAEDGSRVRTRYGGANLRIRLHPGRYFVEVRAANRTAGTYALRVLVRDITTTAALVGGLPTASVARGAPVALTVRVLPDLASGGAARIQVDYLDPLQGWVFRRSYEVRIAGTEASVTFRPSKIGRYRVHADFFGNRAASPSESRAATLLVREATPL